MNLSHAYNIYTSVMAVVLSWMSTNSNEWFGSAVAAVVLVFVKSVHCVDNTRCRCGCIPVILLPLLMMLACVGLSNSNVRSSIVAAMSARWIYSPSTLFTCGDSSLPAAALLLALLMLWVLVVEVVKGVWSIPNGHADTKWRCIVIKRVNEKRQTFHRSPCPLTAR